MKNFFVESLYAVAYRKKNKLLFQTDEIADFTLLNNSWRYWYADPLVFNKNDRDYLFVECFDRIKGKGSIAIAEILDNGIGEFHEVLKEDYHLSYPMVFQKNDVVYMIPEATAGRCVKLYRCEQFPDKWVEVTTLFENVLYADTNVIDYHGHHYLITGEMDAKIGSKTRTLVFLADDIESGNLIPLKNQKHGYSFEERGAGNWIEVDGQVVKPAQGGDENSYGKYLVFSRVAGNEPIQAHQIKRVQTNRIMLNKQKELTGIHTYALSNEYEIIDVKMNQLTNPIVFLFKVIRKLTRHFSFGG